MTVCSEHIFFDLSSRLASNDTIDSVLRHREVGRAKDLSAPRYVVFIAVAHHGNQTCCYVFSYLGIMHYRITTM